MDRADWRAGASRSLVQHAVRGGQLDARQGERVISRQLRRQALAPRCAARGAGVAEEAIAMTETVIIEGPELPDELLAELPLDARDALEQVFLLAQRSRVALDNLRELRAALKAIRDVVEELAPPGTVENDEYLGPEPMLEAEALIKGIRAIAETASHRAGRATAARSRSGILPARRLCWKSSA